MTQFQHAASIHPSREALHASLAEMHFGHLFLDDMVSILEGDGGIDADLALVREGIENEIRGLPINEDEDDRRMQDAVDVLGALDPVLFRKALEDLAIAKATEYLQEFYDDRLEVFRAERSSQWSYMALIGDRRVAMLHSLSQVKRFSY